VNCETARLLLAFHRPHGPELGPDEARALGEHVATCAACGARARHDQAFDQAVAAAMNAVPIPIGLRERLLARVTNLQSARGRQWAVYAAAAALLLAVGLAVFRFATREERVTWADLHALVPPAPRGGPDTPTYMTDRLPAGFPLDNAVSAQLELRNTIIASYVQHQDGKRIGVLELMKGNNRATAFLVPQRNARSLLTDDPGYPGGTVMLRPPEGSPTCVVVLIALHGSDPHVFLRPPQLPTGG
jgi:hypothetical protein